jgi:hypothetical protein
MALPAVRFRPTGASEPVADAAAGSARERPPAASAESVVPELTIAAL